MGKSTIQAAQRLAFATLAPERFAKQSECTPLLPLVTLGDGEAVQPEKGSGGGGPQNLLHRFSFCELIDQLV